MINLYCVNDLYSYNFKIDHLMSVITNAGDGLQGPQISICLYFN
jgi:hypothetical protein